MALPNKTQIVELGFSLNGKPFCKVTAKPTINSDTLEYSIDGSPWWGVGGESGGGEPPTYKIFAGESAVTKMYVGANAVSRVYLGSNLVQEF